MSAQAVHLHQGARRLRRGKNGQGVRNLISFRAPTPMPNTMRPLGKGGSGAHDYKPQSQVTWRQRFGESRRCMRTTLCATRKPHNPLRGDRLALRKAMEYGKSRLFTNNSYNCFTKGVCLIRVGFLRALSWFSLKKNYSGETFAKHRNSKPS